MGVKDLNKIAEAKDENNENAGFPFAEECLYDHIIIDCSNLIVTYLFRHFAKLPSADRFSTAKFDVVTSSSFQLKIMDARDQMKYLVDHVVKDVKDLLTKCMNSLTSSHIVLISDPNNTYTYKYLYNSSVKMTCVNEQMFKHWVSTNGYTNFSDISFDSKEEERKKRVDEQSIVQPVEIYNKEHILLYSTPNYDNFNVYSPDGELLDGSKDAVDLMKFLYQATFFLDRTRVMHLIPLIQKGIQELISTMEGVEYWIAETEADVFIKGIFKEKFAKDHVLMLSNDTDYLILFGEFANVDVGKITPFDIKKIRNPYRYWSELFKVKDRVYLRMILMRLSALFGNDYTLHDRKLVADPRFIEYVPYFFNLAGHTIHELDEIHFHATSSINKLRKAILEIRDEVDEELEQEMANAKTLTDLKKWKLNRTFRYLDRVMMTMPKEYFNGYFETLLIYMNFNFYTRYDNVRSLTLTGGSKIVKQVEEIPYRMVINNDQLKFIDIEPANASINTNSLSVHASSNENEYDHEEEDLISEGDLISDI